MIDRGCSTGDCGGLPMRMVRIEGKGPYPYCDECAEILTRMGDEDCGPFDPVTPEMVDRAAKALIEQGHYYGDEDEQRSHALRDAQDVLAAALRTTGGTER